MCCRRAATVLGVLGVLDSGFAFIAHREFWTLAAMLAECQETVGPHSFACVAAGLEV